MDAVVATDSWLVVVCVTVVATDSWLVVVYAMASVCCSQRSNRMRGVSARCVVCSGGLHASHQRHVATWLAHHAPHMYMWAHAAEPASAAIQRRARLR